MSTPSGKHPIAPIFQASNLLVSPEDQSRLDFCTQLDAAVHIDVTDWEASFLENLITNPRPLTPRQRETVDALRTNYEPSL